MLSIISHDLEGLGMDLDKMDERSLLATLEDACESFNYINSAVCGIQSVLDRHTEDSEGQTIVALEAICAMLPDEGFALEAERDGGPRQWGKAAVQTLLRWGRAILNFIKDVWKKLMGLLRKADKPKSPDKVSGDYNNAPCTIVTLKEANVQPHSIVKGLTSLLSSKEGSAVVDLLDLRKVSEGEVLGDEVVEEAWTGFMQEAANVPGSEALEGTGQAWRFVGATLTLQSEENGVCRFVHDKRPLAPDDKDYSQGTVAESTRVLDEYIEAYSGYIDLSDALTKAIDGLQAKYAKLLSMLERNDGELLDRIKQKHYKGIGIFVSTLANVGYTYMDWSKALLEIANEQQALQAKAIDAV